MILYKAKKLICIWALVLCLFSAATTDTLAWIDNSQHKSNEFNGISMTRQRQYADLTVMKRVENFIGPEAAMDQEYITDTEPAPEGTDPAYEIDSGEEQADDADLSEEQNEIFDYKCKVIQGMLTNLNVFGLSNTRLSMLLLQFGKVEAKDDMTKQNTITLPFFEPKKEK